MLYHLSSSSCYLLSDIFWILSVVYYVLSIIRYLLDIVYRIVTGVEGRVSGLELSVESTASFALEDRSPFLVDFGLTYSTAEMQRDVHH